MEYCPRCNVALPELWAFCLNCGSRILSSPQTATECGLAVLIDTLRSEWLVDRPTGMALQLLTKVLQDQDNKIALSPKDGGVWNAKGALELLDGRYLDALNCFERALTFEPDSTQALTGKGNSHLGLKEYGASVQAFDDALARDPGLVATSICKAYALICIGRYEEALQLIEEAIDKARPILQNVTESEARTKVVNSLRVAFGWKLRAHLKVARNEFDGAIAAFDEVLSLVPADRAATNNKAALLSFLGRGHEAQAAAGAPAQAAASAVATPEPMSKEFTGHGQQVSSPFNLSAGLARFQLVHNGRRHFGVWLLDGAGRNVALLANQTGYFNGSKAVSINRAGAYLLNIDADGGWGVHVQQP